MTDNLPRPTPECATTTRLEEHHLSRLSSARTRTLVMQRKRRILVASRTSDPPDAGTTSLSYSIISIEEVRLSTTRIDTNIRDEWEDGPQICHRCYERPAINNASETSSTTTSSRGRYINALQQRHYLRNGPSRRSRYDSSSDVTAHEAIHPSPSTSTPTRSMSPQEQHDTDTSSHNQPTRYPLLPPFSFKSPSSLASQIPFSSLHDKILS